MHGPDLLRDVGLAILGAALLGVPAHRFKLPLVLAYLAAGVLLGPHLGFGMIRSGDSIATLSEIGLILLMFILGLEIDIKKLLEAGRAVLVNGVTQVLFCIALAAPFFAWLGYRAGGGSYDLVYLAFASALSSTLVVVKILSDRMELDSLTSRISLGILVIQDLWAIGFLAIQSNLGNLEPLVLLASISRVLVLVAVAWALARYALPRGFAMIAKQPELMLVAAMAWCFGICGVANLLHLSLEMGALVAGVSIASFPYHVEIAAKVMSLRDFFITLFFVALGLQIPKPTAAVTLLAGAIVLFAVLSRVLTVFPVLHRLGYGNRASLVPALNISQVSEFSLVLASIGVGYGHISQDVLSAFVLALVATILISSAVIPNTHAIYLSANEWLHKLGFRDLAEKGAGGAQEGPVRASPGVVLLGFHREASSLFQTLLQREMQEITSRILIVDFNPEAHHKLKKMGVACKYADISNFDTLRNIGLETAEILVSTIPDHLLKGTSNLKLLRGLKKIAPSAKVIVTAETFESAREMYAQGADYVFVPRLVSAQSLADVVESIRSGRGAGFRAAGEQLVSGWAEVIP